MTFIACLMLTLSFFSHIQAFENAVPADLTRVRLSISDGSILMTPPNLAGPQLVITLDDVKMSTNLIPDTERSFIDLRVHGLRGLAVESGGDLVEGATGNGAGAEYWKVRCASLSHLTLHLMLRLFPNRRKALCNSSRWSRASFKSSAATA